MDLKNGPKQRPNRADAGDIDNDLTQRLVRYNGSVYRGAKTKQVEFGTSIPHLCRTTAMNLLARLAPSYPFKVCMSAIALSACLAHVAAKADEYGDVNRLVKSGQNAEALNRADQFLAGKPKDPQMRFLKGVILAETGKTSDAVSVFVKLTEEFPELPEPYNNLAVLYASQSQFDKARVALEMAIRTNPSYATAHENLGDVYAKLASQAYSKALQLDGSNAAVPPKLALIRNLFAPDAKGTKPAMVTPTPSAAAPSPAATSTASPPASTAASKPALASSGGDALAQEVSEAVQKWAKAWASKDMDGYLASYSNQFAPEGQRTRKAWEQERRARITSKGSIAVEVSDIEVKSDGSQTTAVFRQRYKSGSLTSSSRKTLVLAKEGSRWMIIRETTGS